MPVDHAKLRAKLGDAQYEALMRQAKIQKAQEDFWWFCKLMAPDFYVEGRDYLKELCYNFQSFYESDEKVMIINLPPRHGKSRTAQLFTQWVFGRNIHEKVLTGSYNEQLSTTFSRAVRDSISEKKADKSRVVYKDVFPNTKLKRGSGAANMWTLEGAHISYLATSPSGTVTGFGGTLMIIDDIVKNAEEAYNETVLEGHWNWFTNTMLSRLEKGGKLIIIATRWNSNDLSGKAIRHYESIGVPVRLVVKRALQEDGTMLCDDVLSRDAYDILVKTMGKDIVEANYNNVPVDMQGRLYGEFKTYDKLPTDENGNSLIEITCAYCDTADKGLDYLCMIIYGIYNHQLYVLDVYYTQDSGEITEYECAKRLFEFKVNRAYWESNSGGRGHGRSVERILREKHHWYRTYMDLFTQSKNKAGRILSSANWIQENVYFPVGWNIRFPQFYEDIYKFQKEIKGNKHDDCADALAGLYDKSGRGNVFEF